MSLVGTLWARLAWGGGFLRYWALKFAVPPDSEVGRPIALRMYTSRGPAPWFPAVSSTTIVGGRSGPFDSGVRGRSFLASGRMKTKSRYNVVRRIPGALTALAAGAAVIALLYPGGLGEAGSVRVTDGASVSVFRKLNGAVADAPSWAGPFLEVAADGLLVVLGLLVVRAGWTALRRRDARVLAGVVLTVVGTVVAYAASEALKLVVDEERPCRAVRGFELVAECPGAGDWSFPSNHAALAAGLAVGLAVLRPRLAVVTLPSAVVVATARVAAGVHYPHDVVAGAALGVAVVTATLLIVVPSATRAATVLLGRSGRRDDPGLVGDHGGGRPVVDGQAREDGADVRLDRSLHHMQAPGDLAVGQPGAEEGQHLAFPGGERLDPTAGNGASFGLRAGTSGGEVGDHSGRDLG